MIDSKGLIDVEVNYMTWGLKYTMGNSSQGGLSLQDSLSKYIVLSSHKPWKIIHHYKEYRNHILIEIFMVLNKIIKTGTLIWTI